MPRWRDHFDELSGTRYRQLVAYARLLTGERESAEDLVHDALVRVFCKPRRFPTVGHAEAYVRRAIASIFVDGRRHELGTNRVLTRLAGSAEETIPDPSTAFASRDRVAVALGTLSPRERTCIVLRYFEDLAVSEVAEVLDISVGATKRYLGDGRRRLATELSDIGFDDTATAPVVTTGGRAR